MTIVPFTDSDHECQFCHMFFRTAADVIDHEQSAIHAMETPPEVEQILAGLWNADGVRRWWNSRNTMLGDRIPRNLYAEGGDGAQAVIDLASHLADGNW